MKRCTVKSIIIAALIATLMLLCACDEADINDVGAKADMLFVTQSGEGIGEYIFDKPVSADKQWRLWCGVPLDISQLSQKDIYVKDLDGNSVSVSVRASEDGSVLSISASDGVYQKGMRYSMGLRQGTALKNGKKLASHSILHFYVESDETCKIAPEKVTVAPNSSIKFTGESVEQWCVGGYNCGTIDKNGVYTAPSRAGEYTVIAKHADGKGYSYATVTVQAEKTESDVSVDMAYEIAGNVLTLTAKTKATVCSDAVITTLNVYIDGELYDVRPVTVAAGEGEVRTPSVIKYIISDDVRRKGGLAVKCELGDIYGAVDKDNSNNAVQVYVQLEQAGDGEYDVSWTAPWAEPYDTQTVISTRFTDEAWQGVIGAGGTLKGSLGFSDYKTGAYSETKAQMYIDGRLYSSKVYKYTVKAGGHGENIPFEYYVPYIAQEMSFSLVLSNGKSFERTLPVVNRETYLTEKCLYIGEGTVKKGEQITLCADVYTNMPEGYAPFEGVAVKLYVNGKYMGTQIADEYPCTTLSVSYTVENDGAVCFSAVADPYSQLGNGAGENTVRVFDEGSTADIGRAELDEIADKRSADVKITDMRILRGAVTGGETAEMTLFITNEGTADCENAYVKIEFADEVLAEQTVSIAAGKSVQKTFQITIPEWTTPDDNKVKYSLGGENGDKVYITASVKNEDDENSISAFASAYFPLVEAGKGTLTVTAQSTTGVGVSETEITLTGSNITVKAVTDGLGVVTFYNLPFDSYTITASRELYAPTQTEYTLSASWPVATVTAALSRNGLLADLSGYDTDKDLLSNSHEDLIGTKKKIIDSDGDGVYDGFDISPLMLPAQPDFYKLYQTQKWRGCHQATVSSIGISATMTEGNKVILHTVPVSDTNLIKEYINEYLVKTAVPCRVDSITLNEQLLRELLLPKPIVSKVIKDSETLKENGLSLQLVKNEYTVQFVPISETVVEDKSGSFYYTTAKIDLVPDKNMEITMQFAQIAPKNDDIPFMVYMIYSDSSMSEQSLIQKGEAAMMYDTVSTYTVTLPIAATQLESAYIILIPVWGSGIDERPTGGSAYAMEPSFRLTALTRTLIISENKETGDIVCITEQLSGLSQLAAPFAEESVMMALKTEQDELAEGETANENAYKTDETVYAVAYMPSASKPYLFMQRSVTTVNERIYNDGKLEKIVQLKKVQSLETTVDIEMYDPDGMWKEHWTKENRFKTAFADFKKMKTPCVLYCDDEDVWLCYSEGDAAKIGFYGADMSGNTKYRVLTSVSGFKGGLGVFINNDNLPTMLGTALKTATLLAGVKNDDEYIYWHMMKSITHNNMLDSAVDIFGSKLTAHLKISEKDVGDWSIFEKNSNKGYITVDLEPIKSYNIMSMLPVSASDKIEDAQIKQFYTWLLSDVSAELTEKLAQMDATIALPFVTLK